MVAFKEDGQSGEMAATEISEKLGDEADFIVDGNIALLILRGELGQVTDGESDWKDVTMDEIRKTLATLKKRSKKALKSANILKANYVQIGAFDTIIGGALKDYWIEAELDVDAFRIGAGIAASLSDMTSTVRVESLNEELFSSPILLGNFMDNSRLSPNIYSFMTPSKKDSEGESKIPKAYLVEYEVKEGESFNDKETGPGRNVLEDFINSFIRYIGLQIFFTSLYQKDYPTYQKSAAQIRIRIQDLNKRIDTLLKGKTKTTKSKKGKKNSKDKEDEGGGEVARLHSASVNFTNLMELDENLFNSILYLNDGVSTVERIEEDLGTNKIEGVSGGTLVINSMAQHLRSLRNTILFGFTNLKENIENSQTRLRNTVDSFKTYQENRRRRSSEKSEKVLNTVFVLFAVIGLADALGNFIIFGYAEGDYLKAAKWFGIDLGALTLLFVLVYFFALKRMFGDS